jgi:hypothetical protein
VILIYADEVNPDVRCIPAAEVMGGADDGEMIVEIELDAFAGALTLRMPKECAEELYHALAFHFEVEGQGGPRA